MRALHCRRLAEQRPLRSAARRVLKTKGKETDLFMLERAKDFCR